MAIMLSLLLQSFSTLAEVNMPDAHDRAPVRIERAQSSDNQSHDYYQDLLERVLAVTAPEYGVRGIETVDIRVSQYRGLMLLNRGALDVFWAGTDVYREENYRPIRIPLIAGLLGYRVPVIRPDSVPLFDSIETAEQLKKLKACQGTQWPDSDILEHNGFSVERVIGFELMYSMLHESRCDYFPRGLNEVYAELSSPEHNDLIAYDRIIIRYPLPMYFFVGKHNQALQERIELGLSRLLASGELAHIIQNHPTTKDAFPLSRLKQALIFDLTNPKLPTQTPLENEALWLKID